MDSYVILIGLSILVFIVLIVHGIWASRREKSQLFGKPPLPQEKGAFRQQESFLASQTDHSLPTETTPEVRTEPLQTALKTDSHAVSTEVIPQAPQPKMSVEEAISQIKISLPNPPPSPIPNVSTMQTHPLVQSSIQELEKNMDSEEGIDVANPTLRAALEQQSLGLKIEPETKGIETDHAQQCPQTETTDNSLSHQSENNTEINEPKPEQDKQNQVLRLYVVSKEGREFVGTVIIQHLKTAGLVYGKYQGFHSHLTTNYNSPIVFSVFNNSETGQFPIENGDFRTKGIAFFMRIPSPGKDAANFKTMLKMAENLAKQLNGFLLDDEAQIFDENSKQRYFAKIQ